MQSTDLKRIIADQQQILKIKPTPLIERSVFGRLKSLHATRQIIIMMGLRRSGKSTLLNQLIHESDENKYYINFEDDRLAPFQVEDFQRLLEAFHELFGHQSTFYLDEIQNIKGWELFARRLFDQGNKLYITGSNASMFSKELGTRLTGRYLPLSVYPFSFREFIAYTYPDALTYEGLTTEERSQLKRLFNEYALQGGLPEYLQNQQKDYLHTLYENIVYKDVIVRHNLTSEKTIKTLMYYLASNIAKDTSYNALKKMLGVSSATTIADYCQYIASSFLCTFIHRYSPSLKQQEGYAKKTYFIDNALARSIGFRMSEDRGRLLENTVFLALQRQGHHVYFYKEKGECDFIIKQETTITHAIQVCISLENGKTRQREINGLAEAMKHFSLPEGYILTEDEEEDIKLTIDNREYLIKVMPVWRWLLTQND